MHRLLLKKEKSDPVIHKPVLLTNCSCKKSVLAAILFTLCILSLLFRFFFVTRNFQNSYSYNVVGQKLVLLSKATLLEDRSHMTPLEETLPYDREDLFKDVYFSKYEKLKQNNMLIKYPKKKSCAKEKSPAIPCNDTYCQTSLSHDLNESISSLLTSIQTARGTFLNLLDELTSGLPRSHLTIVSAASSNHFLEIGGLIKSLLDNVFPKFSNISFYIYDIGLGRFQLHQLKQYCKCEILRFPFHLMPSEVSHVKCYSWKPLIVQAHLKISEFVIWADASVRLLSLDDKLFKELSNKGLLVSFPKQFYRPISQHTDARTFSYFGMVPCSVASYQEMEATAMAFHQQPFVKDLITYAWAVCALDDKCMCPEGSIKKLYCDYKVRQYSKCHRFDQSVITLIMLKLFHENYYTFMFSSSYFNIKRGEKFDYPQFPNSKISKKLDIGKSK